LYYVHHQLYKMQFQRARADLRFRIFRCGGGALIMNVNITHLLSADERSWFLRIFAMHDVTFRKTSRNAKPCQVAVCTLTVTAGVARYPSHLVTYLAKPLTPPICNYTKLLYDFSRVPTALPARRQIFSLFIH